MAGQKPPAPKGRGGIFSKTRAEPKPAPAAQAPSGPSASGPTTPGLTEQQAKEFHEQFKVTFTAFTGLAALAHLLVIAANPWF